MKNNYFPKLLVCYVPFLHTWFIYGRVTPSDKPGGATSWIVIRNLKLKK
jgi:hypothetical protein